MYLDSNVFLYAALYEGPKANAAADLLADVESEEVAAATASLTVDEVVWTLSNEAERSVAIEQGRRLLQLPNLDVVGVDAVTALEALNEMDRHERLSPRDAIHLAAMDASGRNRIVTDDRDFAEIDGIERIGLDDL